MKKTLFEKIAESPAAMLEKGLEEGQKTYRKMERRGITGRLARYWRTLGPGLTTGAADDDPSGIATYSQTGAQTGNQLLWLATLTMPMMAAIQEMCARIGLVTGRGLGANIRRHYSRKIVIAVAMLLFVANVFNLGVDLGAMAAAAQLVAPAVPFALLVVGFTFLSLLLQIYTSYVTYARYLKWLALILLSYVASSIAAGLEWQSVLRSAVLPQISWSKDSIILICAIFGTTISPYLFFWQTSQEVEEEIAQGRTTVSSRRDTTRGDIRRMRVDVLTGMSVSNIVMFFIIAACAATLYTSGITDIASAAQAAEALRPLAGDTAYMLFTLGIIGAGLLAVPVLAGAASYALAESFGWREGLYQKLHSAHAFYGIIIIATILGMLVNFLGLPPIKALIYSAVINGILAPIVLVFIVLLSSNRNLMGEWVNGRFMKAFGWLIIIMMSAVSLATIGSLII